MIIGDSFSSNITNLFHVARYPGTIANGLEISICDSNTAYEKLTTRPFYY